MAPKKLGVAILGSGNIGTDLLMKIRRTSKNLEVVGLVGIDKDSDGLKRAREMGVFTTHEGLAGMLRSPVWKDVGLVFDATSAREHPHHAVVLEKENRPVIDLTPAARGPFVVPVANASEHLRAPNVNLVTCGGQATIPVAWAVSRVTRVRYAEIVASIASRSAGPGTRANIDEFTVTTARGLEKVGGADRAKAIIVLNPAEPPLIMRDTVYVLCDLAEPSAIAASIREVVGSVAEYVPGYRLVQEPVLEELASGSPLLDRMGMRQGLSVSCFLEVEGNGDYLPKYAGNLDIMTSAAVRMGERMAHARREESP